MIFSKRNILLFVVLILISAYGGASVSADVGTTEDAGGSGSGTGGLAALRIFANGQQVTAGSLSPYIRNDSTMVPVRFLTEGLNFTVLWDDAERLITVQKENQTLQISLKANTAMMNGNAVEMKEKPEIRSNYTYVPLRFLVEQFQWKIEWNEDSRNIFVSTPDFDNDLYFLAKIIEAEAQDESYEGKVGVGSVVMNRIEDSWFPDSVIGVIFQSYNGSFQFTPVTTGRIYEISPSEESLKAAKEALTGADPTNNALFFFNPNKSDSSFMRSRPVTATIGNHRFVK